MGGNDNKYRYYIFFAAVCLIFIQRFSFNALYYPVMDDWFLYGDIYADKMADFIIPNEKFAIRPMAGVLDMLFVSPLFRHLWAVEIVMTLLLVIGIFLILDVLRRNGFASGGLFILLLGFLPLNIEATYWLAASIRISSSVFFIGFSCWLLNGFLQSEKKRFLFGYIIAGFVTVSFYEPAIALYLFLSCWLVWKKHNKKYAWILIFTMIHIVYIAIYYMCNSTSLEMEARGHLLTSGFLPHTLKITGMAVNTLTAINFKVFISGLTRGIFLIIDKRLVIQAFAIIVYSVIFGALSGYFVRKNQKYERRRLIFGLAVGFVGLLVFYLLEDTRFTIRSAYFAVIGIAIVLEEIILLIPFRTRRVFNAVLVSVLSFSLTVSGLGIIDKYQNTSKTDRNIVGQILKLDKKKFVTNVDRNTYLLGAVAYYKEIESVEWFESIRGVCSGYADITGCMRHLSGICNTNNLTPVRDGETINLSVYAETSEICIFFALDDDMNVISVSLNESGNDLEITDTHHQPYGVLRNVEGTEYLFEKY